MTFYKNLKTLWKLLLGFGLTAVIVGYVGFEGWRGMTSLNDSLNELYGKHALGTVAIKDANINLIYAARAVRTAILDDTGEAVQEGISEIRKYREGFNKAIEEYKRSVASKEEIARAEAAQKAFMEVAAAQDQILALAVAQKDEEAKKHLSAVGNIADALDDELSRIEAGKIVVMKKSAEDTDLLVESKQRVIFMTVAIAVLIACGLGLVLGRMISAPLGTAVGVLQKVAAGDLTRRLDLQTKDELGQMAAALNEAIERMQATLRDVSASSTNVASASQQLASASDQLSNGAQQQAASLEETAASLEEIASTIKQNADSARQANQLASGARDSAENGGRVVTSAVEAMGEITTASKKIADIITAIDEIAFQTNLLALNAAVEAARAGEQGRGFAVVAAEVRNLAQRSATAAKEIKALIQDSVRKIENGTDLVNQSGKTLVEIVTSVKRVSDVVAEISAASQEQSVGIEQVSKAMTQMDTVTQANSAQTEELSSTAQELSANAVQLQERVSQFHLGNDQERPTVRANSRKPAKVNTANASLRKLATQVKREQSEIMVKDNTFEQL